MSVGKNFYQAEFVAVMAALYFKHPHVPSRRSTEARELRKEARRRIVRIADDSLLRMSL